MKKFTLHSILFLTVLSVLISIMYANADQFILTDKTEIVGFTGDFNMDNMEDIHMVGYKCDDFQEMFVIQLDVKKIIIEKNTILLKTQNNTIVFTANEHEFDTDIKFKNTVLWYHIVDRKN